MMERISDCVETLYNQQRIWVKLINKITVKVDHIKQHPNPNVSKNPAIMRLESQIETTRLDLRSFVIRLKNFEKNTKNVYAQKYLKKDKEYLKQECSLAIATLQEIDTCIPDIKQNPINAKSKQYSNTAIKYDRKTVKANNKNIAITIQPRIRKPKLFIDTHQINESFQLCQKLFPESNKNIIKLKISNIFTFNPDDNLHHNRRTKTKMVECKKVDSFNLNVITELSSNQIEDKKDDDIYAIQHPINPVQNIVTPAISINMDNFMSMDNSTANNVVVEWKGKSSCKSYMSSSSTLSSKLDLLQQEIEHVQCSTVPKSSDANIVATLAVNGSQQNNNAKVEKLEYELRIKSERIQELEHRNNTLLSEMEQIKTKHLNEIKKLEQQLSRNNCSNTTDEKQWTNLVQKLQNDENNVLQKFEDMLKHYRNKRNDIYSATLSHESYDDTTD